MLKPRNNAWLDCSDPEKCWKSGLGFIFRKRTIGATTAVEVVGIYLASKLETNAWYLAFASVCCIATLAVLLVMRRYRIQSVYVSHNLHMVCQIIRDKSDEILEAAVARGAGGAAIYQEKLKDFPVCACERVAEFFRYLLRDQSINCAIRIAHIDPQNGDKLYRTKGRSSRMNPTRGTMTQDVPADKGVPGYLDKRGRRGAIIVRNVREAARDGMWHPTQTDDMNDVRTLIAAPINGFVNTRGRSSKKMLGLIYVTSGRNPFNEMHIESAMAFADLLGMIYPLITGHRQQAPPQRHPAQVPASTNEGIDHEQG